uniref:Putative secreted protein n=1 Tax=Anopheles darlingi TaxID=43151 RepID=A0A2M4D7H7_ANODA
MLELFSVPALLLDPCLTLNVLIDTPKFSDFIGVTNGSKNTHPHTYPNTHNYDAKGVKHGGQIQAGNASKHAQSRCRQRSHGGASALEDAGCVEMLRNLC